jgi:hypothetical protein
VSGAHPRQTVQPSGGGGKWLAIGGVAALLIAGGIALAVTQGGSSDDSASNDQSGESVPAEGTTGETEPGPPAGEVKSAVTTPDDNETEPAVATEVSISISSEPAGADVYLMPSESRLGKTPFEDTLPTAIGERVFVLKLRGYEDKTIAMAANSTGEHSAILEKIAKTDKRTAKRTKKKKKKARDPVKKDKPADPPKDKPKKPKKPKKDSLDPFDKGSGNGGGSLDPFNK